MARTSDTLIEDLERSYKEAQERMSDPSVYNDHREAAEVGRKLKELEGPYKLAQEWQALLADLAAARDDPDLKELVPELEERTAKLEEELRLAMVPSDPADAPNHFNSSSAIACRNAGSPDLAANFASLN